MILESVLHGTDAGFRPFMKETIREHWLRMISQSEQGNGSTLAPEIDQLLMEVQDGELHNSLFVFVGL